MQTKKQRRRLINYHGESLYDGTVFAAYPIRKPSPRVMKERGMKVEADGVTSEVMRAGTELGTTDDERRFRFQNIIATNLNTRRAIRELVLPVLAELREEIAALRAEVAELKSRS